MTSKVVKSKHIAGVASSPPIKALNHQQSIGQRCSGNRPKLSNSTELEHRDMPATASQEAENLSRFIEAVEVFNRRDSMNVKAGQRLWKSKYALTEGIKEVVASEDSDDSGYIQLEEHSWYLLKIGRDVHTTRQEAVLAAEAMRVKRLNSLRKQIKKLEARTF